MTAGPAHDVGSSNDNRAQAPIRWPRPERRTVVLIAVWVVGLVVALAIPAAIVPPSTKNPAVGQTWTAFAFTMLGALVMGAASIAHYRNKRDTSVLTLGGVAAAALVLGGIILVASKLGAGVGQS